MTERLPSVSVVINTLDRADSLADTLQACTQLTHPNFEVVVVCGPSRDHTDEVVARWVDRIKLRRCGEANLSMSRNIGIAAAGGDVVAFIDDDGIPEPTWLDELCAGYEDPSVGAAGGLVYNHTGCEFQVRFLLSDRLGNTTLHDELPPGDFCFPGSSRYPSMLGCNSSFRRAALIEVGGFDEQYDYYLDETDVCLRLVDAGWRVLPLEGAPVHHKYLPSAIRQRSKVVTDFRSVVKNKVYFSIVHGLGHWSWTDAVADSACFADAQRTESERHRQAGTIDDDGMAQVLSSIDEGWRAGLVDGLAGRTRLLDPGSIEAAQLLSFPTVTPVGRRRRLVFITRTLPPDQPGGVGRYMLDLARGLVASGHEVRIVTTSPDHARVDLEQGVWIHRVPKSGAGAQPTNVPTVPDPLWRNAGPVTDEVVRIASERPVDVVFASIWDVEWVGVHARTSLPVVCGYVTPFSVVRATQPDAVSVDAATADEIEELERWAHTASHAVQACGNHIVRAVEHFSGVHLDRGRVFVVPLGSEDPGSDPADKDPNDGVVDVLFVGRLEERKGADLVLAAAVEMARRRPDVRVVLAGDDSLPIGGGMTFRSAFETEHPELVTSGNVTFLGPVDDDELARLRSLSRVALLPSRFESFGLVYVEAMASSTPVVALDGSGAEEVVVDGETGILCPEAASAVADAVLSLLADPELAATMGRSGRARFEDLFTVDAMTDRFEALFDSVSVIRPQQDWPVQAERMMRLDDGSNGQIIDAGESISLPATTCPFTVVLSGCGAESEVQLCVGDHIVSSPVHASGFTHLHLAGASEGVRVAVTGAARVVLASLVIVSTGS